MKATELLLMQIKEAHKLLEDTMADVKADHVHARQHKENPIGATYAHAVIGEDGVIHGMLMKTAPLSAGAFKDKIGTDIPYPPWEAHATEEWMKKVKVDLAQMRIYAKAVHKATEEYIASLKEEDLDEVLDLPMIGKQTKGWLLYTFIIGHIANHTGEISALKGVHGEKGYPF